MSDEPTGWAERVAADVAALEGLDPVDTVQVYGRLHTTLQSALAATADAGSAELRPGR